jgi:hypothetical protein
MAGSISTRPASDGSNTHMIGPDSASVYFPAGTYAVWSSGVSPGHADVTPQGATKDGEFSQTPSKIQPQRRAATTPGGITSANAFQI